MGYCVGMNATSSNVGKRFRFHNRAHYPSLDSRLGTIVSDYRNDGEDHGPFCYGILIDGENKRMAASQYEVEIL